MFTDGAPRAVSELGVDLGDTSTEKRVDGISGKTRPQDSLPRKSTRRFNSEPSLDWSFHQFLKAVLASELFWELAAYMDEKHGRRYGMRGRKRRHNAADWLLAYFTSAMCYSVRKATRELNDSDWDEPNSEVYAILRRFVKRRWPNNHSRRLSGNPIKRSQYIYYREHCLDEDDVAHMARAAMLFAADCALHIGVFDPTAGTLTNPHSSQGITGDSTKLRTLCDVGKPTDANKSHYDPDAVYYHQPREDGKRETVRGHKALLVSCRNPYPNERTILYFDVIPEGKTEGDLFCDTVAEVCENKPEIRKGAKYVCYDMAFSSAHQDRILDLGLIPVVKTPRTGKQRPASMNLGLCDFKLKDGTRSQILVFAVDGAPTITFKDQSGEQWYVPLQLKTVLRRLSIDRTLVYVVLEIPGQPIVPPHLVGATTRIRVNSTPAEINAKPSHTRRTRALRVFPEGVAPQFDQLYGLREDTESTFRDLKVPTQGRVRNVGAKAVRLDLIAYQILTCMKALVSHYKRTGADLTQFFGTYLPIKRDKRDKDDGPPLRLVA
ncbi:MAG: hypothetical protein OXH29_00220 [bacterium]|nr:hypothetical protein [bacterium]